MKNSLKIHIYKFNNTWRVVSLYTNVYIAETFEEACTFAKTILYNNSKYPIEYDL